MSNEIQNFRLEGPDEDGIATLVFDRPDRKVNTLSLALRDEFGAMFEQVEKDPKIKGVVLISGKDNGFVAGADIDVLNTVSTLAEGRDISQAGQKAMDAIEAMKKPVVAAIHGDCLGGGLELAMCCHGRVATDDPKTKLALPEVMLGLLPGSGGTKRLPKLVGLPDALDMMLTGKNIRASKALKMGLVHDVVPKNKLLRKAKALCRDLVAGKKAPTPKKSFSQRATGFAMNTVARGVVFNKAREQVMAQTGGLIPAPLKILEVVQAGTPEAEAQGFAELLLTPESKAQRHLFDCTTLSKKDNGPGADDVEAPEVRHVGMLGGGLMGAGIASVLADKGITVRIKDIRPEGLLHAFKYADAIYSKGARRKRYSRQEADMRRNRISGGLDWAGLGQADVVIEAVPEKLELKQQQVAEIEARTKKGAIFATNTSALPISSIAQGARHPERIVGMHFFSPVEKMPLVEVIVTEQSAPEAAKAVAKLGRTMGKFVIVVNDGPGFYTTRALAPYMGEGMHMLQAGYDPRDVDEAARRLGFNVGPATLLDEVGIDVGAKVNETMKAHFSDRMEFPDDSATQAFLAEGRFGRKANKGIYVYEDGESKKEGGRKVVDPAVLKHLGDGVEPKAADFPVMSERLILSLVNEAAYCFQEGVLRSAWSGDLGAVFGIGFPPQLGGPFHYADARGVKDIVKKLEELAEQFGPRFTPCPLLVTMAKEGKSFYGDDAIEPPALAMEAERAEKRAAAVKAEPAAQKTTRSRSTTRGSAASKPAAEKKATASKPAAAKKSTASKPAAAKKAPSTEVPTAESKSEPPADNG